MSLTSIFTKKALRIGKQGNSERDSEWLTFDAVIEDALEFSVDYTQYPIEIGADASDHGIIRPATQVMTVSVSNNPLSQNLQSYASGFVSNFLDEVPLGSTLAGLSSGFLDGTEDSRAKDFLSTFVSIMYSRTPFDVDSVDYLFENMVITRLRRTRDVENEGGIDLIVEMQELPLLSTTILVNQPAIRDLNAGDPSQSQAAADIGKGEVLGSTSSPFTAASVGALL